MTQESPLYIVLSLHVAVRVESAVSLAYATAAVAPQSGRRQTGMAPVHVPSGLQTLVAKASAATVPSKCSRKLVLQLSEHESPTLPSHWPDVEPSCNVSAPQLISLHVSEPAHSSVLALQLNTAVPWCTPAADCQPSLQVAVQSSPPYCVLPVHEAAASLSRLGIVAPQSMISHWGLAVYPASHCEHT